MRPSCETVDHEQSPAVAVFRTREGNTEPSRRALCLQCAIRALRVAVDVHGHSASILTEVLPDEEPEFEPEEETPIE
jgi:hypothetical protein